MDENNPKIQIKVKSEGKVYHNYLIAKYKKLDEIKSHKKMMAINCISSNT